MATPQQGKGVFITFEGGEGAGKSTLIDRLYETLRGAGKAVVKTRAPGGTSAGEMIRSLLLGSKSLSARAELMLFLADRAQHVEEVIAPALKRGEIVLCDRYNDSTVAYQGIARGFGEKFVRDLCAFACNGVLPDLTLFLDLDPEIGFKRLKGGKDRIEAEDLRFHQSIRAAFHKIAQEEPRRFHPLNAALPPDQVFQQALGLLKNL